MSPWFLGSTPFVVAVAVGAAAAARAKCVGDADLQSSRPLQVWDLQLRLGLDREGVDFLHGDVL